AGGHGLAVEDREVDTAGAHVLDDDGLGGDLDVLQLRQVGARTASQREDDLLTGVDVVRVDEHLQRGGLRGSRVGHGTDATRPCWPSVPVPRSGPAVGPPAWPPASTRAPTGRRGPGRTAPRSRPPRPTGSRRPGAGRPTRRAARTP